MNVPINVSTVQSGRDYANSLQLHKGWMARQQETVNRTVAAGADPHKTEAIRAKLRAGQTLTPAELNYLQKHDSELYGKALRADQDRQTYEHSLRQCRTKSDVHGLHMRKMTLLMSELKHADAEEATIRTSAIQNADIKFRQSRDYAKLPTA